MEKQFSHTNPEGKANMVDVGQKPDQVRIAIATGQITLQQATLDLIRTNQMKKGDVLSIAEFAGIMGGKKTSELIPLCHPLLINKIEVTAELIESGVVVTSEAKCTGKTGIEMEALTAVSIALLTIYDMCKAVDKTMIISNIHLISKEKI